MTTLRVNFENVVKQGVLKRKSYLFGMYVSKYMFYLERGEEEQLYFSPPLLKYGKTGQNINGYLELANPTPSAAADLPKRPL